MFLGVSLDINAMLSFATTPQTEITNTHNLIRNNCYLVYIISGSITSKTKRWHIDKMAIILQITFPNLYSFLKNLLFALTHWGRVTHICVGKLASIVSDNGLSLGRRQAIIWNNTGILLIGPLGTNFSEILIEIHTFSFKKMYIKMSSGRWRPFSLGLNVLKFIGSWNPESTWPQFITASGNDRKAIIWTNNRQVTYAYASLGFNGLNPCWR